MDILSTKINEAIDTKKLNHERLYVTNLRLTDRVDGVCI